MNRAHGKPKPSRREQLKRSERKSLDMQREYLLSQALVYFLGSALIAEAPPPSESYGFLTQVFIFVNNYKGVIAFVLLMLVMFLWYAVFMGHPKSVVPFALKLLRHGAFIPLLFFVLDLLNAVLGLIKSGMGDWFVSLFYIVGLVLIISAIVWYFPLKRKKGKVNITLKTTP